MLFVFTVVSQTFFAAAKAAGRLGAWNVEGRGGCSQ